MICYFVDVDHFFLQAFEKCNTVAYAFIRKLESFKAAETAAFEFLVAGHMSKNQISLYKNKTENKLKLSACAHTDTHTHALHESFETIFTSEQ